MGHVIGQGRKNLNTIQTKTGVALKVIDNKLHINAEATEREEKLAVREIRELVVCMQLLPFQNYKCQEHPCN